MSKYRRRFERERERSSPRPPLPLAVLHLPEKQASLENTIPFGGPASVLPSRLWRSLALFMGASSSSENSAKKGNSWLTSFTYSVENPIGVLK